MSADDRRILNCAAETPEVLHPLVRPCALRWSDLEETGEERVRHCADCAQLVYKVANVFEARARARQGECLAVPPPVYARVHARHRERYGPQEGKIILGFFSPESFIDELLDEGL